MFLIVGLGNPGIEYENTRHNVGFDIIDLIADKYNIDVKRRKFKGEYGTGTVQGNKVILLKPLTYMNLSGESVIDIASFYNIPDEDIIVIHDDISIDVGRMRIRVKGSAGGHNGIKNIIAHLGSDKFNRIKVGVGKPKNDLVSHVLGKFSQEDTDILKQVFDVASCAVETIVKQGVNKAMNEFNGIEIGKAEK